MRERELERERTRIVACVCALPFAVATRHHLFACCTHEQICNHAATEPMLADVLAPSAKVENERYFAVSNPAPGASRGARSFVLSMEQQGESRAHGHARALKNHTLLNFDLATASKRKGLERDIEKNQEVQSRRAPRAARRVQRAACSVPRASPRLRDAGCCPRLRDEISPYAGTHKILWVEASGAVCLQQRAARARMQPTYQHPHPHPHPRPHREA
jgi:hypothetical protein